MTKVFPTEKILVCAKEAIKLWELAEKMNSACGAFIRNPSNETIQDIQNHITAFTFARPEKAYFYFHEIEHGQHAKKAAQMRRYRDKKAALAAAGKDWRPVDIEMAWVDYPGGTRELFNKYADNIVEVFNNRRHFEPTDFIFRDLIGQCLALENPQ